MSVFYSVRDVPVHSVLLLPSKAEALGFPKGDIELVFCPTCEFISNLAFDPNLLSYSTRYEETQAFSPTFNQFHRHLATHLIERFGLRNKRIIEIGCGKGDFLNLLCELGNNDGVGFDPAYVSDRDHHAGNGKVTFINDFYSERYSDYHGDFFCCKMTLEHIKDTADFVSMVRRSIGNQKDAIVFFQIPDVTRILKESAFWDIYYEHCSYFSHGSLSRLLHQCGFEVIDIWTEFKAQYLMAAARPSAVISLAKGAEDAKPSATAMHINHFSQNCTKEINAWRHRIEQYKISDMRTVLWGSGSKAVAFLTTLNIIDEITHVVDINPFRQGTYIAGTGQEIVGKDFLEVYRPDVVVIMNSVYVDEISLDLKKMGLNPRLIAL